MVDKILGLIDNNVGGYLKFYYKLISSIFYSIIVYRATLGSVVPIEETVIMMDFKFYVSICFNITVILHFLYSMYGSYVATKDNLNDERLGTFFGMAKNIISGLASKAK